MDGVEDESPESCGNDGADCPRGRVTKQSETVPLNQCHGEAGAFCHSFVLLGCHCSKIDPGVDCRDGVARWQGIGSGQGVRHDIFPTPAHA